MTQKHSEIAHVDIFSNRDDDPYHTPLEYLDDYDLRSRKGLTTTVIRSLLDKVGSEGDNPMMASILFRAGFESPTPYVHQLYGPAAHTNYDETEFSDVRLYMGYLRKRGNYSDEEPDILTMTESFGRKPYSPYEDVTVSTWLNHNDLDSAEDWPCNEEKLEKEMLKRVMTNNPVDSYESIVVGPNTNIHQASNSSRQHPKTTTVKDMGIKRKHYAAEYVGQPRSRLLLNPESVDLSLFTGEVELLRKFSETFKSLRLEVEEVDMEGGEHYRYDLTPIELNEVKRTAPQTDDIESITYISINIEDRPWDMEYRPSNLDEGYYYSNCWGDMTIDLYLKKGLIEIIYSMRIYMDCQGKEIYLSKATNEATGESDNISRMAGLMLNQSYAATNGEEGLNDIDAFEYQSLLNLVDSIGKCRRT